MIMRHIYDDKFSRHNNKVINTARSASTRGAVTGGGDGRDMSPTFKSRGTSYVLVPRPYF